MKHGRSMNSAESVEKLFSVVKVIILSKHLSILTVLSLENAVKCRALVQILLP